MRIIGLFDYYFLILMFIQFLISNFIDVKKLKNENFIKDALILKRISIAIITISFVLFIVSYIIE